MASPQLENGYAQISNEILEAFARYPSLGSEAFQVLALVLRYTYGFHRKSAELSISFIAKGTGMKRANVVRATERLVSKRILVHEKSALSLNKNHDEWVVSKRIPSIQSDTPPVSKRIPKVVSKRIPKKDNLKINLSKDTLSKDKGATPRTYEDGTKVILLPKEISMPIDDRDRSFPRKRVYGDEKVDWTLDYTEHLLGRKLSGQERWNRIYARHLVNKYGMTKVKGLLEYVCSPDSWWFEKLGQVSTLWKHAERLMIEKDGTTKGKNNIKVIS